MGLKMIITPIGPQPITKGEIDFYNRNQIIYQKMVMAAQRTGPDGKLDPDKDMIGRCTFDKEAVINEYLATGAPLPYDMNPTVARLSILQWRDMIRKNPPPRREDFGLAPEGEGGIND
ncbi:hypothetical protein FACS1894141_0450 [Spirochaetia bacterium]|nr:hypothetical protein FACS1894141_0450 [Spirochaetia bacterium]